MRSQPLPPHSSDWARRADLIERNDPALLRSLLHDTAKVTHAPE
jgi:hypothetical protein